MSRISTYMQNFPQGVSFPRMREIQAPEPIFTRNTLNDAVPHKDVPFACGPQNNF